MKTTIIALFSLAFLIAGVFSAPAAFDKRQASDPTSIVTSLYSTVQQYTAIINSTAAGVSSSSTDTEKAAAGDTITQAIASINTAIVAATSQIDAPTVKRALALVSRQATDPTALATLVETLLLEISGALNNVIATLGLTATLSFLGPLVGSLSGLLLSLDSVVDQLLAVVKQLLDGLLIGLSAALAGLVL